MKNVFKHAALVASISLLAACGGGSDGGQGGDSADAGIDQAPGSVQQFAAQFNAARSQARSCGSMQMAAVGALSKWNPKLQQAAQGHADDMNAKGYFSHTGLDGSGSTERANRAGYSGVVDGEDLANGSTDAGTLTALWLNSPGHCGPIMNGSSTTLAVAQSGSYTVVMFGH